MLTTQPGIWRISFHVVYRPTHVFFGIQKYLPTFFRPRGGKLSVGVRIFSQRVKSLVVELSRRGPLQASDQFVGVEMMLVYDEMHVIGHDSQSVDDQVDLWADDVDAQSDSAGLNASELHRRILEFTLDSLAESIIMRPAGERATCGDFGRRAPHFVEMLGTNRGRPTTARVVRRPEAVSTEGEVQPDHKCKHVHYSVGRQGFCSVPRPDFTKKTALASSATTNVLRKTSGSKIYRKKCVVADVANLG